MVTDGAGWVQEIQVKRRRTLALDLGRDQDAGRGVSRSAGISGCERDAADEYLGTLVNAYLAEAAVRRRARREAYVDVGTLHGYREAIELLSEQ